METPETPETAILRERDRPTGPVPPEVREVARKNQSLAGTDTCNCSECVMARWILGLPAGE